MKMKEERLIVNVLQEGNEYNIETRKNTGETDDRLSYKGFKSLAEVEHYLMHAPLEPTCMIEHIFLYTQDTDYVAERWDELCDELKKMGRIN